MAKMKKGIALLALIAAVLFSTTAYAAELASVTYADSHITVSGTCTTSDQVQVAVFDAANQPIYFATVDVNNNAFNKTLDAVFALKPGETYTVKVADYNGTHVSAKTVTANSTEHTHSYAAAWESDTVNHWHECSCGEKSGLAAHSFGDWTVTKAASATEEGSKERVCSVCGYKESAAVPATGAVPTAVPQAEAAPRTGDTGSPALLTAAALISLGGIIAVSSRGKKRRNSR